MNHDYIVIGAGSAGCVLADRLSASGAASVLMLEAGGNDKRKEVRIPIAFSAMFKTDGDWAYSTEPQKAFGGREIYWPRGKMLGGSSSINAMVYQRGAAALYDEWEALGNPGWGWDDVLPYFIKSEDQERLRGAAHGTGGPLRVSELRDPHPITAAMIEAAVETGFARNDDFNDGTQEGFGLYQVTQKKGSRWSSADAFLKPAMKRPNLEVRTNAHVTRLIIEGQRCVGVEYLSEGRVQTARAEAEVVLSGGAINSPQLMMLSGIGPADHIGGMGIDVVHDLPGVGENLQDHLVNMVATHAANETTLAGAESLPNLAKYLLQRKGMLTSNVAEGGGFVTLDSASPYPELQFHFAPAFFLRDGFENPTDAKDKPLHGITYAVTLVRPQSRGNVRLRSRDPTAAPIIQPNYLDVGADQEVLAEGVRLALDMLGKKAMVPHVGAPYVPPAGATSDDDIAAHVRDHTQSIYHPAGSCKMGTDPMAVVDPSLRVHGIDGLRVADASITPTIPNANTNAPAIMIGEKCADLILRGGGPT